MIVGKKASLLALAAKRIFGDTSRWLSGLIQSWPQQKHTPIFSEYKIIGACLSLQIMRGAKSGLGIEIDPARNEIPGSETREIQSKDSTVKVLVIPTDEELETAEETVGCIRR